MSAGLALASLYAEPTAAQARGLMYADIQDALADNLLIAAYCSIRSSAICGSRSVCDDYESAAPENPQQVQKALKQIAKILKAQGYGVHIVKTSIDIEWGGRVIDDTDEIWIKVKDSIGREVVARLSFYDDEETVDGEHSVKKHMAEPEIIGDRASVDYALDLISYFHPLRKKQS